MALFDRPREAVDDKKCEAISRLCDGEGGQIYLIHSRVEAVHRVDEMIEDQRKWLSAIDTTKRLGTKGMSHYGSASHPDSKAHLLHQSPDK